MSNLFQSIESLKDFLKEKVTLPKDQREFMVKILAEDQPEDSLSNKVIYRKKEGLLALKNDLELMIQQTPYYSSRSKIFNFSFIKQLKKLLRDVKGMLQAEEILKDFANKDPKGCKKYKEIFDPLYQTTERQYQGTLMMPIMQAMDARLGDSGGECFGYIAEWAAQLLQNQKFNGLSVDGVPPFKRVTINSKAWSKFPDLNHLALLTPKISAQQAQQTDILKLNRYISKPFSTDKKSLSYTKGKTRFSISISYSSIAKELIRLADTSSKDIYNLNVRGYLGGHALGFCKINNLYHFMDSNSGWFRFDKSEDFIRWLPFYFQQIKYNKRFAEYDINTYSLESTPVKTKASLSNKEKMIYKSVLISILILLFPIIIIGLVSLLTYMFVIRGMGYAIFQFSNLFKKEKPIRIDAQDIDSTALSEPLSKSLNYLDLAVNPTSFLKQNSSSSLLKLGSILDLPLNKLVEAQKRAETNGEFQRGNMPSIFAKSSEQPVPVEEISGVVQSP